MASAKIERVFVVPKAKISLKYWDDCADPTDILELWQYPTVMTEWINAGEKFGLKVHLSRSFENEPYITEVETRAIAGILVEKYFPTIDPVMICTIAEIESSCHPMKCRWETSRQEARIGVMQVLQSTANWLAEKLGYTAYSFDYSSSMMYRPFASIYFGAAYLQWLSNYENTSRCEEFIVRGYNGGPENATSDSTRDYWNKYLIAKQNIQLRSPHVNPPEGFLRPKRSPSPSAFSEASRRNVVNEITMSKACTHWEDKCSVEDMESMRSHPDMKREWEDSTTPRPFSRDTNGPFLTLMEAKAIAEIITTRFFAIKGVNHLMMRSIAEVSSFRSLYGKDGQGGIMGLSFETAMWLQEEMGFKAYTLKGAEDLSRPFVCMYFATAYVYWLSNYNRSTRTDEYVVRAYKGGIQGVDDPASTMFWTFYNQVFWEFRLCETLSQPVPIRSYFSRWRCRDYEKSKCRPVQKIASLFGSTCNWLDRRIIKQLTQESSDEWNFERKETDLSISRPLRDANLLCSARDDF